MNKNGRKYKPNRIKTNIKKGTSSEKRRERNKELVLWYRKLKKGYSCSKCSETDPRCIDFHHVNPSTKTTTVSWLLGQRYSKKRILEEISKCEPLCSNCHRKHTLKPY